MRSISRVCGVSFNTVAKLLEDAGEFCARFHDENVRGVKSKRVQCDEIWSFVAAKQKSVPGMKAPVAGAGDCWTWTGIDADTKLIVSYMVGPRDGDSAYTFMQDVAYRLVGRVQMTTDGLHAYVSAIEAAFDGDVDFAQLMKVYGASPESAKGRYSPAECIGISKNIVEGTPDPKHISTSFVERQNLTMRMSMRRFTRLTNGFSKKVENHVHALAIYFVYYNFLRVHSTLRVSPAMAAGITGKLMDWSDIIAMMDAEEVPTKRGVYKPRISK